MCSGRRLLRKRSAESRTKPDTGEPREDVGDELSSRTHSKQRTKRKRSFGHIATTNLKAIAQRHSEKRRLHSWRRSERLCAAQSVSRLQQTLSFETCANHSHATQRDDYRTTQRSSQKGIATTPQRPWSKYCKIKTAPSHSREEQQQQIPMPQMGAHVIILEQPAAETSNVVLVDGGQFSSYSPLDIALLPLHMWPSAGTAPGIRTAITIQSENDAIRKTI